VAKKLSGWESNDGQIFLTESECLVYERVCKIIQGVDINRDYDGNDYSITEDNFKQYQIEIARALAEKIEYV